MKIFTMREEMEKGVKRGSRAEMRSNKKLTGMGCVGDAGVKRGQGNRLSGVRALPNNVLVKITFNYKRNSCCIVYSVF